jgi:acyl-coenzyme A thioesterase PaaI-like protein
MWHTLGARSSSAPALRFLCAMTVSSGAMCFLNNCQDGVIQSRPSCGRLGKTFLFFDERNTTTMCEEAPTRRKEVESYHRMPLPARGQNAGHAIFGLLLGEKMIESYEVFRRPEEDSDNENVIVAYVKLGDRVDGHPGVVHGGILSLIFDDALGFGYEAIGVKMAFTANLNVDFRAPVLAGTYVRVVAQLEHQEGRKLFWKAQMTSMDEKTLFAEASSLYIIPRSAAA